MNLHRKRLRNRTSLLIFVRVYLFLYEFTYFCTSLLGIERVYLFLYELTWNRTSLLIFVRAYLYFSELTYFCTSLLGIERAYLYFSELTWSRTSLLGIERAYLLRIARAYLESYELRGAAEGSVQQRPTPPGCAASSCSTTGATRARWALRRSRRSSATWRTTSTWPRRYARRRAGQARELPHVAPLVRDGTAGGRVRYPDDPGAAGASGCEHDDDLHARAEPRGRGGAEPARRGARPASRRRREVGGWRGQWGGVGTLWQ